MDATYSITAIQTLEKQFESIAHELNVDIDLTELRTHAMFNTMRQSQEER